MDLDVRTFLSAEDVVPDYCADSKEQLLNELCARAAKATHLDAQLVRREILKREQLGCTGIGGGIAIPHARLQDLKKPFGSLVCLRKPIGYDAIDGHPVDIVFFCFFRPNLPATSSMHLRPRRGSCAIETRSPACGGRQMGTRCMMHSSHKRIIL
jgi:mannitol/fructose-specific phosphotransferase system IIA component (Ntr-type)